MSKWALQKSTLPSAEMYSTNRFVFNQFVFYLLIYSFNYYSERLLWGLSRGSVQTRVYVDHGKAGGCWQGCTSFPKSCLNKCSSKSLRQDERKQVWHHISALSSYKHKEREREIEREAVGMLTTRPQSVIAAEGGKGVKEVCNGVRLSLTDIHSGGKKHFAIDWSGIVLNASLCSLKVCVCTVG